jgi:hypothetical protein
MGDAKGAKCTIYEALLTAKKAMVAPKKNSTNPHFKSKYADLSAVMEAAIPALHDAGIVVVERLVNIGSNPEHGKDRTYLETSLVLADDPKQTITASWPIDPDQQKGRNASQAFASSLTYGRRYLLQTMCGLAAEDDDGNAASKPRSRKPSKPKPEPVTTPSEARREVNTQLWKKLWAAAMKVMTPEQMWEAVWTRRPKLKIDGKVNQTQAMIVVGQLTELDFKNLWDGVEAMAEAKKRDEATYDPDTGEALPPREPGGDDREGE